MTVDEIRKALGLSFYFQGGYVFNTRDPRSQENDFRIFDHKANSFMLDLAQIRLQKEAPMGGLGFKFKLSFGETARFIHSRGLGDTNDTVDLTEAYVDYLAPLGKGLKVSFGKFVTMHGAEVIEAIDNFNYSRSFLFNYAIPFTHTGFRVYYPFSDQFNVAAYLVNGWDNTNDNNRGKTHKGINSADNDAAAGKFSKAEGCSDRKPQQRCDQQGKPGHFERQQDNADQFGVEVEDEMKGLNESLIKRFHRIGTVPNKQRNLALSFQRTDPRLPAPVRLFRVRYE